jgi:predicted porin
VKSNFSICHLPFAAASSYGNSYGATTGYGYQQKNDFVHDDYKRRSGLLDGKYNFGQGTTLVSIYYKDDIQNRRCTLAPCTGNGLAIEIDTLE